MPEGPVAFRIQKDIKIRSGRTEEIVRLDTQYINDWSLGLDIKILLKTIVVVLKKDGSR